MDMTPLQEHYKTIYDPMRKEEEKEEEKEKEEEEELNERIWSQLSDEHLDRIRAFLPASSLFRFRCVCRRWSFLTSDAGFLELYSQVQSSSSSSPSVIVISHDNNHLRVSAFFLESFTKWYPLPIDFLPHPACIPLAADGGLVLVSSFQVIDGLYVCNPLTKAWRHLPSCQLNQVCKKLKKPLVNMMVNKTSTTKNSYKVIVVCDPSHTKDSSTIVKMYDSKVGQWWSFSNSRMQMKSHLGSTSLVRNGQLYWCTLNQDGLCSFDMQRGSWSHTPLPFPRLFTPFGEAHLILLEGRSVGLIGLKVGGPNFAIGIWKLQEAGGSGSGRGGDGGGGGGGGCGEFQEWMEMAWQSPPSFRRSQCEWSGLQGFWHEKMVCLASRNTLNWVRYDLEERTWIVGEPAPAGHGTPSPLALNHNWCFYDPKLDITP